MAQTIFITISRGIITRNLLQTGTLQCLVDQGYRVVLVTTAWQDVAFRQAFERVPQVVIEPMTERAWTRLDELLVSLHRGLIYNKKIDLVTRVGVYDAAETNIIKYWLYRGFFQPLSKLRFLRDAMRWLDAKLLPVKEYDALFEKYKPAVLFSTNIMEFGDSLYVKAARRHAVPVIGMPKSWDNLSKTGFRALPDQMLVWSPYMRDETMRFQNMRAAQIVMTGVPQFDLYAPSRRTELGTREDFLRSVGLDPTKRTILYGSEGKTTPRDPEIVQILVDAIRTGELPQDLQLLVRPHFGYRKEIEKFASVTTLPNVVLDTFNQPSNGFHDQWDWCVEHWHRLAQSLAFTAGLITSASTLTLDATAMDKPVINIAFDGYAGCLPYAQSMTHWYDTEHYQPIAASGVPHFARNREELIALVKRMLEHPEQGADRRAEFRQRFCGAVDGQAATRIADAIHQFICSVHPSESSSLV